MSPAVASRSVADRKPRSGFTVTELLISLGILMLVMVAVGESVGLAARQRRATQRRQLAVQTAENEMERLFARPWSELTPEKLADLKLPAEVEQNLPGATLKLEVAESAEPFSARRLRVEVGWNDEAGAIARPVRLTAWRYKP